MILARACNFTKRLVAQFFGHWISFFRFFWFLVKLNTKSLQQIKIQQVSKKSLFSQVSMCVWVVCVSVCQNFLRPAGSRHRSFDLCIGSAGINFYSFIYSFWCRVIIKCVCLCMCECKWANEWMWVCINLLND